MRRHSFFWGMMMTLAGILLLLRALGLLTGNFGAYFWAILLIVAGIWLLVGQVLFRRTAETEMLSIPLENITEAQLRITFGAGLLNLEALEAPGQLIAGSCYGSVEKEMEKDGSRAKLKLRTPADIFFPPTGTTTGFHWNLGLNRDIPLNLKISTGASENTFNLEHLKVTELKIQGGASSTNLTLPAQAGFTRVELESGAASANLQIPEGVAARIRPSGGLMSIDVDKNRFPETGGVFETPGYETAPNRVEINIRGGVGSVQIH